MKCFYSLLAAAMVLFATTIFSENPISNSNEIRLESHADYFWRDLIKKGIDKIKNKFGSSVEEMVQSDAPVDCAKVKVDSTMQTAMDFSSYVQQEYCNKGYQDECMQMMKKAGNFMNCFR